jgi:hypothetical protein
VKLYIVLFLAVGLMACNAAVLSTVLRPSLNEPLTVFTPNGLYGRPVVVTWRLSEDVREWCVSFGEWRTFCEMGDGKRMKQQHLEGVPEGYHDVVLATLEADWSKRRVSVPVCYSGPNTSCYTDPGY